MIQKVKFWKIMVQKKIFKNCDTEVQPFHRFLHLMEESLPFINNNNHLSRFNKI